MIHYTKQCPLFFLSLILIASLHSGMAGAAVLTGADQLLDKHTALIRGKRVGLITNATGVDNRLRPTIDLLFDSKICRLVAIFGPEHGARGEAQAGARIEHGIDAKTGVRVYSLYGGTTRPTREMLSGIDVLVYDIQDIGARYYTFISTLFHCMQAAAEAQIPFVVLDRPNPINGRDVGGNLLDMKFTSFVGIAPIPMRYGMTPGELARYFNGEFGFKADLTVVPMTGWKRNQWFDETGLPWIFPSPNIPTLESATVYPGWCLIEGTNLSEGRGTTRPFELVGAPWIDGLSLAEALNSLRLPGVLFRPVWFTPTFSKHKDLACSGIQVHVVDRNRFDPVRTVLHFLRIAERLYPGQFEYRDSGFDRLAGTDTLRRQLRDHAVNIDGIVEGWKSELDRFAKIRQKYLLY